MIRVLFIGGTGQISSAIVRRLAKDKAYEVWLLNRGNNPAPEGVHQITVDVNDTEKVKEAIKLKPQGYILKDTDRIEFINKINALFGK